MEEPKNREDIEIHLKGGRLLRNLATNVKGPAVSVVLVIWIIAVVITSIYNAYAAVGPLSFFIAVYLLALANRPN
jgi:hypothetical protein